jgi:hypothetical protein
MCIDLFLITLITVFIVDISGIIDSVEASLSKWLKGKVRIPKPFSCSLCMTWWVGLIYILCLGEFNLINISLVALFAHLSGVLGTLLVFVREILIWVIEKAYNALN